VELRVSELRGLEPLTLPAEIPFELQVRSVSFRFGPLRYLRFRLRVLTASRAVTSGTDLVARWRPHRAGSGAARASSSRQGTWYVSIRRAGFVRVRWYY
jgi:hypothetical protein